MGGGYEVKDGAVKKYYSIAGMMVAVKDSTGAVQYLLTDHLGSTVAVTNASGTLTSQQRYLPFGAPRTIPNSPILGTDFGYTGQRMLDSGMGGIMDYKARFYSPALGRFVQPDSIIPNPANPQNFNRFGYVLNNPIVFTDPTGHNPVLVLLALVVLLTVCTTQATPSPEQQLIDSSVHITTTNGDPYSIGTIINPNTALTHNHFDDGYAQLNQLVADGQPISYFDPVGPGIDIDEDGNPGTGVLTVDANFSGSPVEFATQEEISALTAGDIVQVVYWDDVNSQLTVGSFSVIQPASDGGWIYLNDPNEIINLGDSGGGVFHNNNLIGNMLGITGSGTAVVATLPSDEYLTYSTRGTTRVR